MMTTPARFRQSDWLTSFALGMVLALISTAALLGGYFGFAAGNAAKHATEISSAFEEARYSVGAEESLERKYRLEPGPEIRTLHHEAGAALLGALERASRIEPDAISIKEVAAEHAAYSSAIERMFAAVDAHDTELANKIDSNEIDPPFVVIVKQVLAAAAVHRADAANQLEKLVGLQTAILVGTPLVFLPGLALVVWFWRLLRRYGRKTEEGEHRFRSLVQNSSDVILICSASSVITYTSPTAETAWGFGPDRLIEGSLIDFVHPDDQAALRDLFEQVQRAPGTTRNTEVQLCDATGDWRPVNLILTNLLHEPSVGGIVLTAQDITARKIFEEQLRQQAFHDSLTGLPNRALLHDRLDQALTRVGRRRGRVSLIFLDLDNFKQVNDGFGHPIGDDLLKKVASRLRSCVREDNTVARFGGDEFVILLDRLTDDSEAVQASDRIAAEFSRPFELEGREVVITASMGIVLGTAGQDSAENMLRDADVAMYRAKGTGRARHVIFEASMHIDTRARLELESDLRQALLRNELRVHYQPIMSFDTGEVAEVEALVRWLHPTRGLIVPADFIPVAEETGLIVPLGQWVLEQACRQVAAWQAHYPMAPPLTVSVNLSPRQFQQPNLLDEVRRALRESGLAPSNLKLEITEGMIMRDVESTIRTLWQLKDLGIQIAIDDFGTGYSSLAYLKRLPIDVLKIDRSFVDGIGEDHENTAIVRAIISMAKSLHLSITAEGIETAEQSAMLQSWACDRGQGYFYARPLTADKMSDLLETSHAALNDAAALRRAGKSSTDEQVREAFRASA